MPTIRPLATAHAVVAFTYSNRFARRLVVSILLTGCDVVTILIAGPSAYSNSAGVPVLRATFVLLFFGMLASLSHVWFLTFRDHRSLR